jgi:hypothetical protein
MIVRCRSNTGETVPATSRDSALGINADTVFPLTIGRSYEVFAMTVFLGIAWYHVLNDDGHDWPTWAPAPLFDVADGTLPRSWRVGYVRLEGEDEYPILSFPEWATDHEFYERLVDGDADAVCIFNERRQEIEEIRST